MRWWPPMLHLLVLVVLVPLAVLRVGAAVGDGPVPVAQATDEGAGAVASTGAAAVEMAGKPVDLDALTARPLFVPGRQGVAAAAETPVVAEAQTAPDLRMVGYLDDGTQPRAILSLNGSGAEAVVRVGDVFEGFEVRQITRDAVVVINRGEEITVKLFDQ